MKPDEALGYLAQVANDYARTLQPSAAGPFQQVAQDAVNTLAQVVQSAHADTRAMVPGDASPERPTLHGVP